MVIVRIQHQVPSIENSTFTSVFLLCPIRDHWEPALLEMMYAVRLWIAP